MANIDKNLERDLKSLGYDCIFFNNYDTCSPNDAKEILVNGYENRVFKTIKLPLKKQVTVGYLLEKINKDTVYSNFSKHFKSLLKSNGLSNGLSVYPTSYGIGVSVLFNSRESLKDDISKLLESLNIDFASEYSEAHWVFRYKISKSKNNINKIKDLAL